MDKKANQITEGVIWKQLLIFFFPIAVGTFFQQLYNMVDTIVVGHFVGKEALASVEARPRSWLTSLSDFLPDLLRELRLLSHRQ